MSIKQRNHIAGYEKPKPAYHALDKKEVKMTMASSLSPTTANPLNETIKPRQA